MLELYKQATSMNYNRSTRRSNSVHVIDFMEWVMGDMPWQGQHRSRSSASGPPSGRRRNYPNVVSGQKRLEMDTRSHTFSKESLDEFRQIFEFYDVDNNRIMDMGDLDVALRALGFSPSESEVEDVIALMDVDGDKTIDFTEFCMIIEYLQFKKGKYGELREAFRSLDLCNEGLVLEDDVTQMLTSHAKEMTLKEINDLVRFTKTDELDTINYSKFVDAVEKADCDKNNDKDEDTFKLLNNVKESFSKLTTKTSYSSSSNNGATNIEKSRSPSKKRRNVETIDSLVRALGGPILITSAVIITANTEEKPSRRWPPVKKVLSLQKFKRNRFFSERY
ncbi:uncharacterized protein LOC100175372 [Ciona intestinalis]